MFFLTMHSTFFQVCIQLFRCGKPKLKSYAFLYVHMVAKTIRRKKNLNTVKGELLSLLREYDTVEEEEFNYFMTEVPII